MNKCSCQRNSSFLTSTKQSLNVIEVRCCFVVYLNLNERWWRAQSIWMKSRRNKKQWCVSIFERIIKNLSVYLSRLLKGISLMVSNQVIRSYMNDRRERVKGFVGKRRSPTSIGSSFSSLASHSFGCHCRRNFAVNGFMLFLPSRHQSWKSFEMSWKAFSTWMTGLSKDCCNTLSLSLSRFLFILKKCRPSLSQFALPWYSQVLRVASTVGRLCIEEEE
jgi:hypothetical protein